jgi:hypothetical protein
MPEVIPRGNARPGGQADLGIVALASLAIFTFAHWQGLTNPYVINDDVRQQLFWMLKWQDPELFRHDLLTEYARHYVPWGVESLYWLASWIMSPIFFSKVLPGILFVGMAGCLFKLGEAMGKRRLAWIAVGVYWLMPFFLDRMSGGLARAFAGPLLALFWYSWLTRRPGGMGLALLLQALFIPYIFPVAALAALLACLVAWGDRTALPPFPRRWFHWILLLLMAGLVFWYNNRLAAAGFGPMVGLEDLLGRLEFTAKGRYAMLPSPPLVWELGRPWELIALFPEGGAIIGALSCLLLLGLLICGSRRVDWLTLRPSLSPACYLGLSSILLFILAQVFLLQMFVPDRYLSTTLNLGYCLFLALCLESVTRTWHWPRPALLLALGLVVMFSIFRLHNIQLYDYSSSQPLFIAVEQIPKDALIAGHPDLMDPIPALAGRRAFATYELAHPWSKGFWQKMQPRFQDLFAAYYAPNPEMVWAFARKYGIDFLIVDQRHFTPDFLSGHLPDTLFKPVPHRGRPFFAPFDQQIQRLVQGRNHFAVLIPENFPFQTINEHWRILDLRENLGRSGKK